MNVKNPADIYKSRLEDYQARVDTLEKQISVISFLRFLTFATGVGAVWYFANHNQNYIIYSVFIVIIVFLFLVRKHNVLIEKKRFNKLIVRINREETASLRGKWKAFDGGGEFLKKNDIHTADLDVFGEKSLFQKINRTATLSGKHRLALWFRFPHRRPEDITGFQNAVKELAADVQWRQNFRATALMQNEKRGDYVRMLRWMKEDNFFSNHKFFLWLQWLFPITNISLTTLYFIGITGYQPFAIAIIITLLFIGFFQKRINRQHKILSRRANVLLKYTALLKSIEDRDFDSTILENLKNEFSRNGRKAHESINDFVKILQALDQRLNMLMGILLNIYLFWDIRHLIRIEKWKKANAEEMVIRFNNIGIFDAFCSLANLSFNEPFYVFPKISDDKILSGKELRHPLMAFEQCVPNDIEIDSRPHFKIITGANMAGKSTYLRTVGTNLLLAMMGAPVNASAFEFVPLKIATSLRTTDSLMKNESYFYSELKRLQTIIGMLENGENVFVLLDEILKGTNSKDKELGSIAILEQLIVLNACGIIATHDLNLAKVSERFSENTENLRFEAEVEDDKLIFDYKLKKGVARNLNATFLMKKMGIGVSG